MARPDRTRPPCVPAAFFRWRACRHGVFSCPGPRLVEVFHDQGISSFVPEDRRGEPLEQGRLGPSDWVDCWDRQDSDGDYPTGKNNQGAGQGSLPEDVAKGYACSQGVTGILKVLGMSEWTHNGRDFSQGDNCDAIDSGLHAGS